MLATRGQGRAAEDALAALCAAYRPALLAHYRRCREVADAEDLTQSFFLHFLEQQLSQRAEPARGSFRGFLFSAAENHRRECARRALAGKRAAVFDDDEGALQRVASADADPQRLFDRDWALLVIARARDRLRDEAAAAGKLALFEALQAFLGDAPEPSDYAAIGEAQGMTGNSVAVAVKRLRERLRTQVRRELADTLPPGADLERELAWLRQALRTG